MSKTKPDRLRTLIEKRGVISSAEAARVGAHSQQLTRLVRDGVLERISRGQYRRADHAISENHSLLVVARAAPGTVVCLLSALAFHDIGTQLPSEVWVAIDRRARMPALAHPPLRVTRFSGAAFTHGVETHVVEGQTTRVYSAAKTVADLFKYRNKVGLDVAIEALREAWRERKMTMAALDDAARVCRVERVMRPYVQSVVV